MFSNLIFHSFRSNLRSNQLNKLLRPSIMTRLMDNTNKSSMISLNRLLNTSDKKKGHGTHDGSIPSHVPGFMDPPPKGPKTVKEFADVESQKNWVSYGWDIGNMENDRFINRWGLFLLITVLTVFVPYILAYFPDYHLADWSVREAYLEIDRRERLGLPLIDKNVVDPSKLELPSEEELGDTDIYI